MISSTRPPFKALLRANLPVSPWDWAAYLLIALVLRFFFGFSAPVTAIVTVAVIPLSVLAFAAGNYFLPGQVPAADDDEGAGDG